MSNKSLIPSSGAPVLDLTDYVGKSVSLNFNVSKSSDYSESIGFYKVKDYNGAISNGSLIVKPGDENYKSIALASDNLLYSNGSSVSLSAPHNQQTNQQLTVVGGSLYAPYANISSTGDTFFAWPEENPSQFSNIRNNGSLAFSLEDIAGGGDQDYDDLQVSVSIANSGDPKVPVSGGGGAPSAPTVKPSYFSISDAKVMEGDIAKVLITRSGNLNEVQYMSLNSIGGTASLGKDYNKVSEAIIFAKDQKTYTSLIPTLNDSLFEPTEFISLILSSDSSNTNAVAPNFTRSIGYVSILDTDDDNYFNSGSFSNQSTPIAISGGIKASGGASISIPANTTSSYGTNASIYWPPAQFLPFYGPSGFLLPSSQNIAISGGVQASENSKISIGVDPISPGVNLALPVDLKTVALNTPFNAIAASTVDMLHFLQFQPINSYGISGATGFLPFANTVFAPAQFASLVVSPQQLSILQSGSRV